MPAQTDPGAATASPPFAKTENVTVDVPSTAVRLKGGVRDEMFSKGCQGGRAVRSV